MDSLTLFLIWFIKQQNGKFGSALAIVDLNADGVNDLAVSAPTVGSDALLYNVSTCMYY